jgi:hypothetical protein
MSIFTPLYEYPKISLLAFLVAVQKSIFDRIEQLPSQNNFLILSESFSKVYEPLDGTSYNVVSKNVFIA